MLDDNEKRELANAIMNRIQSLECPMCHSRSFTFLDGYLFQNLQSNKKSYIIGNGPFIPSVALVCNNCGFMSQHNLGALGMLNKESETKE